MTTMGMMTLVEEDEELEPVLSDEGSELAIADVMDIVNLVGMVWMTDLTWVVCVGVTTTVGTLEDLAAAWADDTATFGATVWTAGEAEGQREPNRQSDMMYKQING